MVHKLSNLQLIAIGGLDPSGGSGVLRDGLAARSLGSTFRLVGTAWAEQSAKSGVQTIDARPPCQVAKAIELALHDAPAGQTAVKIGMVVDADLVRTIAGSLEGFDGPVVFDPVLAATAGGALFNSGEQSLVEALRPLLVRCTVFTPNATEAALLCNRTVDDVEAAAKAAWLLAAQGASAVVVKGGHLQTALVTDVLVNQDLVSTLSALREPGPSVRGTGCSYASALALFLASGMRMQEACRAAQEHVADAIRGAVRSGAQWHLGHDLAR